MAATLTGWKLAALLPEAGAAMSRVMSPVGGKPYGLAAVCRVWRLARPGVYRRLFSRPKSTRLVMNSAAPSSFASCRQSPSP